MLTSPVVPIFGDVYRSEFVSIYRRILEVVPDLVEHSCSILFQSYPGEFSQEFVDRLIMLEPLSPILLFLGSALEGELRTGFPLVGCFRFYVHQWNEEYLHQLFLYWRGEISFFSLPRTVENDEIAIFRSFSSSCFVGGGDIRRVLVVSRFGAFGNDLAMNRFLVFFYRCCGFEADFFDGRVFFSGGSLFDVMLIADVDDSPFPKILESVQRLRCDFADSRLTVYINSPRINEKNDLREAGVDVIISKPVFW
jgi:hypothetical protein